MGEVAVNIASSVATTATKAWNSISDHASRAWDSVSKAASDVWNSIKDAVSNAWEAVKSSISGLFSPIAVDLDGDGVELIASETASFDLDGDGFLEQTAWIGKDDGFLVIDLAANGARGAPDGKIAQTKELAFSNWTSAADTDMQALASLEKTAAWGNGDGKLTAADAVWSELRIWRDTDGDAVVDSGELRTLASWGITEVRLSYSDGSAFTKTSDDITVHGSTIHGHGSIVRNRQTVLGATADVSLGYKKDGWRTIDTASGFTIDMERGRDLHYREMTGTGSANYTLPASGVDGVTGDARANAINASAATWGIVLRGESGNDMLTGGAKNDRLYGGEGADVLRAGAGDDILYFDAADTEVRGGSGRDLGIVTAGTVNVNLKTLELEALHAASGNDTVDGRTMTVALDVYGRAGSDRIDGGSAGDRLYGGGGNDSLYGHGGNDAIDGGSGNDLLSGLSGDDLLSGGAGADSLYGGDGNDVFHFDRDDVLLRGGSGYDLAQVSPGSGAVSLQMTTSEIEAFIGGSGNDTVSASSSDPLWLYAEGRGGNDSITFGKGNDRGFGNEGNDLLNGIDGNDQLDGGSGNDTLLGGSGNDQLDGGSGNDLISGGNGKDIIIGGSGDDHLTGGHDADRFIFSGDYGKDRIEDFGIHDRIVFSGSSAPRDWGDLDWNYETFRYTEPRIFGFTLRDGNNEIDVRLTRYEESRHFFDVLSTFVEFV